ncbi:Arf-GAP with Rho-GAP domain [Striga asiatica]|uniref:Arf-GAP with Rho-GAP domain n=1 Tax=Striga asiatica TaxID=4170 RepID=A0A5A7PB49_STRAF|nr:Arf-GAP with Rho-GAP domain [Striga asiatica]
MNLRLVRFDRSGTWPENPFAFRLRSRRAVSRVIERGKPPRRPRFSRTKWYTRPWRHETPSHEPVHGSDEEFQDARTTSFGSAEVLRRRSAWVSGLVRAEAQLRRRRRETAAAKGLDFGFPAADIVVECEFFRGCDL